jgi:hypothetical protein
MLPDLGIRKAHCRLALLELGADALPDDELFAARGALNPPAPDCALLVDAKALWPPLSSAI